MDITSLSDGKILVSNADINLPVTLDCGQAFRWEKLTDGSFSGTAMGKTINILQTTEGLIFSGTNKDDITNIWFNYFDFANDYKQIIKNICEDKIVKTAYEHYGTIRILNQDPWETVCSFIISACNNIPRIKGIIRKLCDKYGNDTENGKNFPDAKTLAVLSPDDLSYLHAGYRVPYILDAAIKTASEEIDFNKIRSMPEKEARSELMKIKGVGRKVADCTMLFSLGFKDVWPVDVHIKRAQEKYYPEGLPQFFHPYSGIAQQYVFHFQRMGDGENKQ